MASQYKPVSSRPSLQGTPYANGIEPHWTVPDHLVKASPGGVDTATHHHTGGFYGTGASSADWYGHHGRDPHGVAYGMYQSGPNSGEVVGTRLPELHDPRYYQSREPISVPAESIFPSPSAPSGYGEASGLENFSSVEPANDDVEMVPDAESQHSPPPTMNEDLLKEESAWASLKRNFRTMNPILTFTLFVVAFIALDFWASTGNMFLEKYFMKGKTITWKHMGIAALVVTALLALLTWIFRVPLFMFESL